MAPWNMSFAVFLLDPRPFEEWRPALDEIFGGRFMQDLEYKADGRIRYTNYVFGLTINCFEEASWTDGKVYFLVDSNDACCRFDTSEEMEMDMAFHVRQLLSNVGLARIMTFDEFRDESRRRKVLQE